MPTQTAIDFTAQAKAITAFANHVAQDQHFAREFEGAVEREDEERTLELAKQAMTPDIADAVQIHPSATGICICRGNYCVCVIKR